MIVRTTLALLVACIAVPAIASDSVVPGTNGQCIRSDRTPAGKTVSAGSYVTCKKPKAVVLVEPKQPGTADTRVASK